MTCFMPGVSISHMILRSADPYRRIAFFLTSTSVLRVQTAITSLFLRQYPEITTILFLSPIYSRNKKPITSIS